MEKVKEYKFITMVIAIFLAAIFYWYEWRPAQARKGCIKTYPSAFSSGDGRIGGHDKAGYERCLRQHGVDK